MAFEKKPFRWLARGLQASEQHVQNGVQIGQGLPAQYVNEQFSATYEAVTELQEKAAEKEVVDSKLRDIAINVKDFGALDDGVTDSTDAIQQAIDFCYIRGGGRVLCTLSYTGVYMIDAVKSINMKDNVSLILADNVELQAITTSSTTYSVIKIIDVNHVTISGGVVRGDRNTHTGTTGEWGNCIELKGASDVTLRDIKCVDAWGDGLYIGSSTNQNYCENVIIDNFVADNNRRQGISIISVKRLRATNLKLVNTQGVEPGDGIDIEPNNNSEFLQDIVIDGIYTANNAGSGIKLFMGFYKESKNDVSIVVRNHHDVNSDYGFRAREYISGVNGYIKLENCKWFNDKKTSVTQNWSPFYAQNWAADGARIEAIDCTVEFGAGITSATNIFGFMLSRPTGTTDTNVLGNVHLIRPTVTATGLAPQRSIYLSPSNSAKIKNVSIIDPVKLDTSATDTQISTEKDFENFVVSDRYGVLHKSLSINYQLSNYRFKKSYDNSTATSAINIVLPTNHKNGHEFTITNLKNAGIVVSNESNMLYPLISSAGKRLRTTQIGASITLFGVDGGYLIKNITGEWSVEEV